MLGLGITGVVAPFCCCSCTSEAGIVCSLVTGGAVLPTTLTGALPRSLAMSSLVNTRGLWVARAARARRAASATPIALLEIAQAESAPPIKFRVLGGGLGKVLPVPRLAVFSIEGVV